MDMCMDICMDMPNRDAYDMCIKNVRRPAVQAKAMCIDMRIGLCVDMCIDMRMDMCMDLQRQHKPHEGLPSRGQWSRGRHPR